MTFLSAARLLSKPSSWPAVVSSPISPSTVSGWPPSSPNQSFYALRAAEDAAEADAANAPEVTGLIGTDPDAYTVSTDPKVSARPAQEQPR